MKFVNSSVRKKDAMDLVTGKPVYTKDLAPADCLVVKLLRSPHANAMIASIDTSIAKKVPGIEDIFTYKDVPEKRFTMAGQTYPEPSPYDRLILDRHLRYVGDPVAIIAGENEKAVDKAMKLVKVTYEVLEPLLDFRKAKDHKVLIHPEESWMANCPVGADNKRNLCAVGTEESGEVDAVFDDCDVVIERAYHTKANQQAMMETFRAYSYMDLYGRITVVASTQIAFHVRRIIATALDVPKSKIRIIKPRIGGGFGAKQSAIMEVYPAFVTKMTGKKALLVFTRKEAQTASCPRHEMEITVKMGADKDGTLRAVEMFTLSDTGAYGEHGPTTVGLSGHKSISLYGRIEAYRFSYEVVYTNHMSAGAYRGYGATQGIFALESCIDEMANELQMDSLVFREKNMTKEGDFVASYDGADVINSCSLDRCVNHCKELIGWNDNYPRVDLGNGKVRAVGMALAMQGSSIANCDVASVAIKVNDDGFYSLMIGAADMGTGCDTILAQMAADCLECDMDNIVVYGVDTDISPYDSGSYASSTTYLTGKAVEKTCLKLKERILSFGADALGCPVSEVEFDGKEVICLESGKKISLKDMAYASQCNNNNELYASESCSSPVSPPPFMVGMAEVEVDLETGKVDLINYKAVVDCGTVVNTNLARIQTEGGIVQGIGMALFEDVRYNEKGVDLTNSFLQYKIPTRLDMGTVQVEFESSYEPTGPFGAKSIGEIVINTPAPAIANAVYNATGIRIRELPITPEKVLKGLLKIN